MMRPEHNFQVAVIALAGDVITVPHRIRSFDRSRNVSGMQHLWEARRGVVRGNPDTETLALTPGGLVSANIELKAPGTKHLASHQPSIYQEDEFAALRHAGAYAACAWSCVEVVEHWAAAGIPMRNSARLIAEDRDLKLQARHVRAGGVVRKPGKPRARVSKRLPADPVPW